MSSTARAHELLMRIMGVDGEDADVPLPVLVNLHRGRLRAPLERLDQLYGGHAQSPWMRASLIVYKVEQRWPSLKDGEIFGTDVLLANLAKKLPTYDGADIKQVTRNPNPAIAELLRMARGGWTCLEPLVLLHELTHQGMGAPELDIYERLLARELELDPAVIELINEMAGLT